MSNIENGKVLNFLYNIQNRRKINIFYAIFTKIGLAYVLTGYYLFAIEGKGALAFALYLAAGNYIYRNKMNYRFYHQDRLYFYHMFTEYLGHRKPVEKYNSMYSYLTNKNKF